MTAHEPHRPPHHYLHARNRRVRYGVEHRRSIGIMAKNGWSRLFEDPVLLPNGRELLTLKAAADYIMKLPKAEQKHEVWLTAIEVLIMAAEGRGPVMHARIGVTQALNRNVERVFTDRKDHHWGKRKLARDR
jgi:hypothetical protein